MSGLAQRTDLLTDKERAELEAATATLEEREAVEPERIDALRALVRLQERVWARVPPDNPSASAAELGRLADSAVRELGGTADPPIWSLRDYDADQLGPILGVSDDGDAGPAIVRAFLDSPKAVALRRRGLLSTRTIGACLDAERMSAAGELLVGIDEYTKVRNTAVGRIPITTNVGTVVLPRFYRTMPFVTFTEGGGDPVPTAIRALRREFEPYRTPPAGGKPLPIIVYVAFRGGDRLRREEKLRRLSALADGVHSGEFCDPAIHRLGLLQRANDRGSSAPKFAVDLAADAGLTDVAIESHPRYESQDQLLLPGLLSFFPPERVNEILAHAAKRKVAIRTKNRIDVATAARTIWAGLTAARTMGAQLGKFGLFPLTLEEQIKTIELVRPWFGNWSATPAFYVDRPLVTEERVYRERELVEPATRWLEGAAAAGADVVLFDAPDRTPAPAGTGRRAYTEDRGRRLLKQNDEDELGVLTLDDLERLDQTARSQPTPVRILWAGGLSGRQAFELARRKAFGIFTTSTTARRVAVGARGGDPTLASELEPTYFGVLGVRMLIEAGFLAGAAKDSQAARALEGAAEPVLQAVAEGLLSGATDANSLPMLERLRAVLEQGWEAHLDQTTGHSSAPSVGRDG